MVKYERFCMQFFSTLANPIRIAVLQSLLQKEKNVTEIVKDLNYERTLVSHNLATLLKVNLISFKKKGKERTYYANEQIVPPLFFLIENFVCSGCSFRKVCKIMKKRGLDRVKIPSNNLEPCLACKK
ncbi:winged helix-turn-helix transcriptional regulator [Candidatus Micrarchaeota archaeon]|nr:winged helix-turn-helix transcriptional regulator [Candidatus Micrarchaeota archaeon]